MTKIIHWLKKDGLIKRMNEAIADGDYKKASIVAVEVQNMAFWYYIKKIKTPKWIVATLKSFNTNFGWLVAEDEDEWEWK